MNRPELSDNIPHIRDFLAILRKRVWLILLFVLVPVTLVAIQNFMATPIYRATAMILIERTDPKVVNYVEVIGQNTHFKSDYDTQVQLLTSRTLAQRVAKKLRLSGKKGFGLAMERRKDPLTLMNEWVSRFFRVEVVSFVRKLVESNNLDFEKATPAPTSAKIPPLTPEDRAVSAILGRLSVSPMGDSRLVRVHFEDSDPAMAKEVVNALSELYLERHLELRFTTTKTASDWLEKEIDKARKAVIKTDQQLQRFKEKYRIVSLEERQSITTQKLAQINTAVTEARTRRIAIEVLAKRIRAANGNAQDVAAFPDVLESSIIQNLKKDYIDLLREFSEVSKRYKERHPRLVRLSSKMELIEKKIQAEKQEIANRVLTKYQVELDRERSLMESLEQQKREALRLDRLAINYRAIKRETEANRELYQQLLKRSKETGLMEGLQTSNIRIVDEAKVPSGPIRPRRMRNILIAFGSSLVFGILVSVLLDQFDSRVRTPAEVTALTRSSALGAVADLGRRFPNRASIIVLGNRLHPMGREHFREMRTMLLTNSQDTGNVIQITSCLPREGKTFIAVNLALMMSLSKKRVLLIGGDFQRPKLQKFFDIVGQRGILDVLNNKLEPMSSIYSIARTSLGFIPSGRANGDASTLLLSPRAKDVMKEFKEKFDYIFVDSAPLLAASDSLAWSRCVDGVLFVVDMKQANADMINQAVGKLNESNAPIIGTIFNRLTKHHKYYYHGYHYNYRAYYRVNDKEDGLEDQRIA